METTQEVPQKSIIIGRNTSITVSLAVVGTFVGMIWFIATKVNALDATEARVTTLEQAVIVQTDTNTKLLVSQAKLQTTADNQTQQIQDLKALIQERLK